MITATRPSQFSKVVEAQISLGCQWLLARQIQCSRLMVEIWWSGASVKNESTKQGPQ